jgi:hypothetical protein
MQQGYGVICVRNMERSINNPARYANIDGIRNVHEWNFDIIFSAVMCGSGGV